MLRELVVNTIPSPPPGTHQGDGFLLSVSRWINFLVGIIPTICRLHLSSLVGRGPVQNHCAQEMLKAPLCCCAWGTLLSAIYLYGYRGIYPSTILLSICPTLNMGVIVGKKTQV